VLPPSGDDEELVPRLVPQPREPTQGEREAHQATHQPYASWCAHCIAGRGRDTGHFRSTTADDDAIPTVQLDYGFLRSDEPDDPQQAVMVGVCSSTGYGFASAAQQKGGGDVRIVKELGGLVGRDGIDIRTAHPN